MIFFKLLFMLLLIVLAFPAIIFILQTLVALIPYKNRPLSFDKRPSIIVLIPAHNESSGIEPTLTSVNAQLNAEDKVIVIADNCSDDTDVVAESLGAEVIKRFDEVNRGKGYALDFGIRYIEKQGYQPETLVIVDADCLLHEHALDRVACQAIANARPVQALYIMKSPPGAGLKIKIAEFAWIVKNWARPLGYLRLGLPCQLMGTGMAFPWALIQKAEVASGHIVEDLKLGLDLAHLGVAPQFCPEAIVTSMFPLNADGINSQRTRWEHGHLGMIVKDGPKLIWQSIKTTNIGMLALALDMCVPPLALLILLMLTLSVLAALGIMVSHEFMPWIGASALLASLAFAVLLAWVRFGRSILSLADLAYAPVYALMKIPVYLKFIVRRQVEWVRSRRD